jgi:hypothetical protein
MTDPDYIILPIVQFTISVIAKSKAGQYRPVFQHKIIFVVKPIHK